MLNKKDCCGKNILEVAGFNNLIHILLFLQCGKLL